MKIRTIKNFPIGPGGFSLIELLVIAGLTTIGGAFVARMFSLQNSTTQKLYQDLAKNDLEKDLLAVTQNPITCSSILDNLSFDSTQTSSKLAIPLIKTSQGKVLAEPNLRINANTAVETIELSNLKDMGDGKFSGEWLISLRSLDSAVKSIKPIKLSPQIFKVDTSSPALAKITDCLTSQGTTENYGKPWVYNGNDLTADASAYIGTRSNHDIIIRLFNQISGQIRSTTVALGFNPLTMNSASTVSIGALANSTGSMNTAIGYQSLATYDGYELTAVGHRALASQARVTNSIVALGSSALGASTNGTSNVALGFSSLAELINGQYNIAVGAEALQKTNGNDNIAIGYQALRNNIGNKNIAIGNSSSMSSSSLSDQVSIGQFSNYFNTTGQRNTAVGYQSQYGVSGMGSASDNTSVGDQSLMVNSSGNMNTAFGIRSLYRNNSGNQNLAMGGFTLNQNTSGSSNTAIGYVALYRNTVSNNNTAIGYRALENNTGAGNTAVGYGALQGQILGSLNTSLGAFTSTLATGFTNSTFIGRDLTILDNNKIRLGTDTTTVVESSVPITTPSDQELKENIQNYHTGLDFILKLRPVTYQYKYDREKKVQIGFLAQEVKRTNSFFPGLIEPSTGNHYYSLRYSDFVVPLTNALKEFGKVLFSSETEEIELENKIQELESLVQFNSYEIERLKEKKRSLR